MSATPSTIVLVHGAFTDASVWHEVIPELQACGHRVVAPAMPMRGLAADAAYLHSILETFDGPIVLGAHSYGGSVISHPDATTPAVEALAFIAAFQPDTGETAAELNARFPGSRLVPEAMLVRAYPGGDEVYLRAERFGEVYAADVAPGRVAVMAAAQHPIDPTALGESFGEPPSWRTLPSWALIATADRSIPAEALRFMAARAGSTTVEVDAAHAAPVSNPSSTAALIAAAAGPARALAGSLPDAAVPALMGPPSRPYGHAQ